MSSTVMGSINIASRIALLQILVIFAGIASTSVALKLRGYPDAAIEWHWGAVAVRNYGFLLLAVPAIWAATAIYLQSDPGKEWTNRHTILTGLIVLAVLVAYLSWTTIHSRKWTLIQSVPAKTAHYP